MIAAADVSCVLVTRNADDVEMPRILESLPFDDVFVYDNSRRTDHGIYGRYAGIREAKNAVIVVQDDDLIVTCWDSLLAAYEPGVLTVNYPHPWDIPWVARGAIFDCDLPARAFEQYLAAHPFDRFFTHFACDGVFALLADRVNVIDEGSIDLDYANAAGRVSTSPGWYDVHRPLIQHRCDELKVAA